MASTASKSGSGSLHALARAIRPAAPKTGQRCDQGTSRLQLAPPDGRSSEKRVAIWRTISLPERQASLARRARARSQEARATHARVQERKSPRRYRPPRRGLQAFRRSSSAPQIPSRRSGATTRGTRRNHAAPSGSGRRPRFPIGREHVLAAMGIALSANLRASIERGKPGCLPPPPTCSGDLCSPECHAATARFPATGSRNRGQACPLKTTLRPLATWANGKHGSRLSRLGGKQYVRRGWEVLDRRGPPPDHR